MVIKRRITLKRVEAAKRIAKALKWGTREECSVFPRLWWEWVKDRDHLIWRMPPDPSLKRQGPVYLSLNWQTHCLPALFCQQAGRTQPTPTPPFCPPGSQLLSALFKAKRWGGLKSSLSQASSWSLGGHGPHLFQIPIPSHPVRLLKPLMLRPRYRMWFANLFSRGSCVSV